MTAEPTISSDEFRGVLGRFPTGVTAVTANGSEGLIGVAIGSFASVSLDPPLVGFFLGKTASSWPGISAVNSFCVNILAADQVELCGAMASKRADKFDGIEIESAPHSGAPILPGVAGWIDCRIWNVFDGGDHHIVIGRVMALDCDHDAIPMVFLGGSYGRFSA